LYKVAFFIYCRGLDSEVEIERCQKIASRLEELLREENQPDRQLSGLPQELSWCLGAIQLTPSQSEFLIADEIKRAQPSLGVLALVEADLEIPAVLY
jgi:hypothetical protein